MREIVREARINLEKPIEAEKICTISTLTALETFFPHRKLPNQGRSKRFRCKAESFIRNEGLPQARRSEG